MRLDFRISRIRNSVIPFFVFFCLVFQASGVKAEELKTFLRSCGYGTLVGAGVGLASLVFEKKPNESYNNIARGASLGLYAGIGYGFYLINQKDKTSENYTLLNEKKSEFLIFPDLERKNVSAIFSYQF